MQLLLALRKRGVLLIVYEFLRGQGFNVKCVDNGLDAQEALALSRFDLVISEEYLAYKSGLELIAQAQQRGVPTLIIGDTHSSAKIAEALDLGASKFITKPYRLDELRTAISEILKSREHA